MATNTIQYIKTVRAVGLTVLALIIVISVKPFYILKERETAIITQFGEIIKTETKAGLHFKMPVLHQVHKYTAKLLRIDGDPQKILTKEKQFIKVNTTSRWRISDIRKFYQSLVTYESAYSRLSDIIDSSVRDIITVNSLANVVRSTNDINKNSHKEEFGINPESIHPENVPIANTDNPDGEALADAANGNPENSINAEAIVGTEKVSYPKIDKGRDALAAEILHKANNQLDDFGIEVIDIIFKEIKYSDELQVSVYNRMIKDRNQIAQAASYGKSPEFYSFWKSMEVYQSALPETEKILSTDMEYFKYLYKH